MEKHFSKLRRSGYKITPRRKEIISLFTRSGTHLAAEDVWAELKKKIKKCGFPGVYRNLEELTECGVLTRIQMFDRKKHYGLCNELNDKHHHHITCVKCGKVDEVDKCAIEGIGIIKGYKVVSHFVQINGVCESCLKRPGKAR